MHRDSTSHPQATLDRLVGLTEHDQYFLQHALLELSYDQQIALGRAVERLLAAPWTVLRDEQVALDAQGWPPRERVEPQLATMAEVLEELDACGLLPQAVRRVQARLSANLAGTFRGETTVDLHELVGGPGTVAWYWDVELGYGGSVRWADEWLPGPPVGGLWVAASDDDVHFHELGRMDQDLPALRLQRLRARQLRLGWVEGGWGHGMLVGLGFVYGERWSPELATAVDEVLVALAPVVGRLTLMPSG